MIHNRNKKRNKVDYTILDLFRITEFEIRQERIIADGIMKK